MVNVSKLLNDPEQQAKGYLNWLTGTGGYYYVAFIHEYQGLTLNEMQKAEPFLLAEIKDYYHTKQRGYYLDKIKTDYHNFQKTTTYYVKLGVVTKGKAVLDIQQVGKKFNLFILYTTRSKYGADAGQPNTFRKREPNLALWHNPAKEKAKRRYKNRIIRKKGKAQRNEIKLNKVHTSDAPRYKRTKRRH